MRKTIFLLLITFCLVIQSWGKTDSLLMEKLKRHVYFLADDSLEGRATGSIGEKIAYQYIRDAFKSAGLEPGNNGSFIQDFSFVEGRTYGDNNRLMINGKSYTIDKDYYPLVYSANKAVSADASFVGYGISSPELKYNDYKRKKNLKGNIFIIDISSPEGSNPHAEYYPYIDLRTKIDLATEKGASGVIFINTHEDVHDPETQFQENIFPSSVPVVFLKSHVWNDIKDEKNRDVELSVELNKKEKTGHNVLGFIDNNAKNTIVIGGHYDHLGWGESGGSLYRGDSAIHNGADDNASGIAVIIELAKMLKSSPLKSNNYLFLAFSGEELGLFGSNYFVNNATIPLDMANYMINFDMVGRLDPVEKNIQVSGFGTSAKWKNVLDKISIDSIHIKTSDGGIGPSDHTSFYLKDIPVLHFFTGAHEDYHKPSDDAEFVNYAGMASITHFVYALIDSLNDDGHLDFVKVKEDSVSKSPKFTVTLGVIPNYMFDGEGMKIDGVSEGKPAAKAGIKDGDIVVELGGEKVTDLMAYMKALSLFKKGDSVIVKVRREDKLLEFPVSF